MNGAPVGQLTWAWGRDATASGRPAGWQITVADLCAAGIERARREVDEVGDAAETGYCAAGEGLPVEFGEVVRRGPQHDATDRVSRRCGCRREGAVMSSDNGFRFPLDVRFFEVDSLGVVFNMWYLGWCDEAMSAFMESIGYGYATLRARGFDAVLRKAEFEWLDSLEAFQHAEVTVRVDHMGRTSFRLRYDIERVDESGQARTRCAQAAITYVCVEIAGRNTTPIPDGLREALLRGST